MPESESPVLVNAQPHTQDFTRSQQYNNFQNKISPLTHSKLYNNSIILSEIKIGFPGLSEQYIYFLK